MSESEEVKKIKDFELKINLDYLARKGGRKAFEDNLQKILGIIILITSFAVFGGLSASLIISGKTVLSLIQDKSFTVTFSITFLLVLYSLFLLRNKEGFDEKLRTKNLYNLKKKFEKAGSIKEVEISEYMSYKVEILLDKILNSIQQNYISEIMLLLLDYPKSLNVLSRLGLEKKEINRIDLSKVALVDEKSKFVEKLLKESFAFAYKMNFKLISEEVLLLTLLKEYLAKDLSRFEILSDDLDGVGLWLANEAKKRFYLEKYKKGAALKPKTTVNRSYTSRYSPTLNRFSRDFTMEVLQGDFSSSIAREDELDTMIRVLEKGDKSAVVLVGEPGVGKTTLIKSLAVRMIAEDVPKNLQDKRLVGFDFIKAHSSARNVDIFKSRLEEMFDEVAQAGNVILVLDNIDQLLNIRPEIAGEVSNIIVDSLDRTNFRLVASTSSSAFAQYIRPNVALAGLLSPVEMKIPSDPVAVQILIDEVGKLEKENKLGIAYKAVKTAVQLSHKIPSDRVLPDKAIDLLKETIVAFRENKKSGVVDSDTVAEVVSSKTGVSMGDISKKEAKKLENLEEIMHKRVIGQEEAIKAVAGALKRARTGISGSTRPVASFLFFGPTGVGKTEVAKTVAETYYGNENKMIRLDMSEYNEEENLKRLIGFVNERGVFEGALLTEPVHKNPYSLVLLDELDKANPKVLDLFLQVLDEGYLVDGLGRKVDFTNTIIIATSNTGSAIIASLISKGEIYEEINKTALEELKKVFRIEFLNRFDKIIMFNHLTKEQIKLVARKFIDLFSLKLKQKGITLKYDDKLLEKLADLGYDPVYGAREMRRVVVEEVENKVAEMIIEGKVRSGGEVRL